MKRKSSTKKRKSQVKKTWTPRKGLRSSERIKKRLVLERKNVEEEDFEGGGKIDFAKLVKRIEKAPENINNFDPQTKRIYERLSKNEVDETENRIKFRVPEHGGPYFDTRDAPIVLRKIMKSFPKFQLIVLENFSCTIANILESVPDLLTTKLAKEIENGMAERAIRIIIFKNFIWQDDVLTQGKPLSDFYQYDLHNLLVGLNIKFKKQIWFRAIDEKENLESFDDAPPRSNRQVVTSSEEFFSRPSRTTKKKGE